MFGHKQHDHDEHPEATPGPPPVPHWRVPAECPNCGGRTDASCTYSVAPPHCEFCQEQLPATPIAPPAPAMAPGVSISGLGGHLNVVINQAMQGMVVSGGAPMVIDSKAHLHTDGIPGQATIVSVRELRNMMGTHVMEFQLQVEVPGRPPYMAMTRAALPESALRSAVAGAHGPVKVDPNDEHTVLIEFG